MNMKNKAEGDMLDHENKMMSKFKAERDARRGSSKQVIVIRKDLNMRKGKMISQGAHASMSVLLDRIHTHGGKLVTVQDEAFHDWLEDKFTKITVYVESEEELLQVYEKAKDCGLPCSLIKDAGLTEFTEPTHTCVAVGPGWVEEINSVTGHLKLL